MLEALTQLEEEKVMTSVGFVEFDTGSEDYPGPTGDILIADETNGRLFLDLKEANALLESLTPQGRIAWADKLFGLNVILASSMQKTASAQMGMFSELGLYKNEIVTVNTGRLFPETLGVIQHYREVYGLNIVVIEPESSFDDLEKQYGPKYLLNDDTSRICCTRLKKEPFLEYIKKRGFSVVVNGLMRAEGGSRGNISPLIYDDRTGGLALSPLLDCTDEDVENYIREHDLLVHPLHDQYPSIGCIAPCTVPVPEGYPKRWGRFIFRDETGKYCTLNRSDCGGDEESPTIVEIPYGVLSRVLVQDGSSYVRYDKSSVDSVQDRFGNNGFGNNGSGYSGSNGKNGHGLTPITDHSFASDRVTA